MAGEAARSSEGDVLLGVVIGAHGLKGEVRVKTFTDTPASLAEYGPVSGDDGRQFQVASLRVVKSDEAIVSFKGLANRDGAESLKGVRLSVPRSKLPPPEEGEFYLADLVGLAVEDAGGHVLGMVRGVHNFGAGDVIEIEASGKGSSFVPFTSEAVPVVDLAGKRIVVVIAEDGADEK